MARALACEIARQYNKTFEGQALEVAAEALNVGMELHVSLEALEAGRVKDLERLAEKGRKPGTPDDPHAPKPDPSNPPKPAETPGIPGSGPAAEPRTNATVR